MRLGMMVGRKKADALQGTLDLLVLTTLQIVPMHGYAIAKRIKDVSNSALAVEEGSLYPALNRMLVKGWLEAEWGTSETNRKARFYKLTKAGRQQLRQDTAEFERLVSAIQLVLREA